MGKIGKVFMLDDDVLFLQLYQQLLEARGYEVFATDNAYKLLMYGQEIVPDVMFLDVNMPRLNGWEVLNKINENTKMAEVPIVVLSVNQDEALADVKGVAHFLYKPLAIDKMMEILESYCVGGKDHDILLIEDYLPLFNCCSGLMERLGKSCFCTHDIKGAKKYLKKNKPKKIMVRYSPENFEKFKTGLPEKELLRVENFEEMEKLAEEIK